MAFIGEYSHTLDTKGRMAVPVKFRGQLGGKAIITRGLDKCLFVFNQRDWDVFVEKMATLPIAQANARAFSRLMLAGAVEAEFDSQGRVLIPEYLREYAGLQKNAVAAGVYNRFEIWDAETWKQYKQRTEAESGEIAEKLSDLGMI